MSNITLNISSEEFNIETINKIKSLFNGRDFDISIRAKEKETREQMRTRIEKALNDTETGENLINFSAVQYEHLVKQLSSK